MSSINFNEGSSTSPRWRVTCAANKHVEALIREGTINATSINDENFMSKLHVDNKETKRFSFERFMKGARDALKKIDKAAGTIGKLFICFVYYYYCLLIYFFCAQRRRGSTRAPSAFDLR